MNKKRVLFILSIFIVLIFAMSAYSANDNPTYEEVVELLETNSSDLTGCCSVVCQLDGNNSIMTFRRDAEYSADIYIEQIDWHGKQAIKQYKTEGGYFSQVIITSDGWTIGYGGSDDGKDSEYIENITADMVVNNNISESGLQEIQDIKTAYNKGHVIIKAPDGTYGAVINDTHFTGKLQEGEYLSLPNKYQYFRSGDIQLNASDKIKIMQDLEISDGFGLERRDITTFYFHQVDNDTFKGNVTELFMSNDDGSYYGMDIREVYDDIHFNGTVYKGSTIPVAPVYRSLGTIEFSNGYNDLSGLILNAVGYIAVIILLIIIFVLGFRTYSKYKNTKKGNVPYNRNSKNLWGSQNKKNRR